ncbi:hypothetical protein [Bacteriovorax sp. Seq25_V]|uniref:hypothetical protein n=1 Tax=Bacteriovorax sp. Seq25_V TaxID=1201288 RepID=UPI00038A2D9C|nr:hypothetical protein [Bacteriovorax sp. Seq25_V]EQC43703.1 hypothetical protein M900_1332 [Bacteriovorax sp. Seq25_V]
MLKVLLLSTLLSASVFSAGLEKGDEFQAHYVSGNVSVTCFTAEGTKHANFRCTDSYLTPSMGSKFVTDEVVDADKVTLTYVDSRGKKKSKSSSFKGTSSKSNFNLWIWTLTQRPMLQVGENEIEYKLTKKKSEVMSGAFNVVVNAQQPRTCSYRSYTSSLASDCEAGSNICSRYFRDQNDCL